METTQEIKAFNQLFAEYYDTFVRFADTYLCHEAAEDIVMEAMMYYWERRNALTPDSNIPAYIMEVIKHKCLNALRHQRVRQNAEQQMLSYQQQAHELRIATLESCNPHELFGNETQLLVREALQSLPTKTRRIFLMSRYGDKSYSEIAVQLSLSVKSVEFHISKALKLLRIRLKDYLAMGLILLLVQGGG